uniref:Uncharacterized protein n=1 Tax=viral metagenome TaxID=1070528 RepID=A0A6C0CEP5_9ZZZZ
MKVCLVALAIGDKYLDQYNYLFRKSHEAYAEKHGYEFRVETDYLEERCPDKAVCSLNKILVCSQPWSAEYDFIIFIDSDIYINISAPPIHSCMNFGDKIGIINEYDHLVGYEQHVGTVRFKLDWGTASEYYAKAGFILDTELMLNTGVLVMQPAKHGEFLRNVFDRHVKTCLTHPRRFHYEQAAIGYELQTREMYTILPKKFNAIWFIQKIINEQNRIYERLKVNKDGISHIIHRRMQGEGQETREQCINRIAPYFRDNYFIHLAGTQNYERVFEFEQINIELSNNEAQGKGSR